MRYTGKIEITFEFAVPGDDPTDDYPTRTADTATAAAAVVQSALFAVATEEVGAFLVRFDHPTFESQAIPHEDDPE